VVYQRDNQVVATSIAVGSTRVIANAPAAGHILIPHWSATGRYITFSMDEEQGVKSTWIVGRDGSGMRLLFAQEERAFYVTDWLPDDSAAIAVSDRLVTYGAGRDLPAWQIFRVTPDGQISPPLAEFQICYCDGWLTSPLDCAIYGFDLWQEVYFADPNLGPDFVRDELRRVGHRGAVELVSGSSAETVPSFLRDHPDLYFDLVTIDGAKAFEIVASDYANALPRLKIGGVIVTDDLAFAPALGRIWHELVGRSGRFIAAQFSGAGGVSAAIRFAGEPWQSTLRSVAD
jgi:hypothetical protein